MVWTQLIINKKLTHLRVKLGLKRLKILATRGYKTLFGQTLEISQKEKKFSLFQLSLKCFIALFTSIKGFDHFCCDFKSFKLLFLMSITIGNNQLGLLCFSIT